MQHIGKMAPSSVTLNVKMTCQACVKRVTSTLEALPFVSKATVSLEKGTATGTLQGEFPGCECPKPDGKCPCGDKCQCAATAMSKALVDAGYVVTPCGGGKGPCPAVALGTCTCGPNCECGDDCQCALCPGVSVKGKTIELKVEHALVLAGLAGLVLGYALGKRGAK